MSTVKKHRITKILMVGLLAWLCWIFMRPIDHHNALSAIPADVIWITEHRDIHTRWKKVISNPMVQSLLFRHGIHQRILSDARLTFLAFALIPRQIVLAQTTSTDDQPSTCWYFSSRAGWRATIASSLIRTVSIPGLRRVTSSTGDVFWRFTKKSAGPEPSIKFIIRDGLIAGCYSHDNRDMDLMLNTLAGKQASVRSDGRYIRDGLICIDDNARDRGWLDTAIINPNMSNWASSLMLNSDQISTSEIRGRISSPAQLTESHPLVYDDNLKDLYRLSGNSPSLLILSRAEVLIPFIRAGSGQTSARAFADLMIEYGLGLAAVIVYAQEPGNTLNQVWVPSTVVAVQAKDTNAFIRGMFNVMAQMNDRNLWNLGAVQLSYDSGQILTNEINLLAFGSVGSWMLISSSPSTLHNLMAQHSRSAKSTNTPEPPWMKTLTSHPAELIGWFSGDSLSPLFESPGSGDFVSFLPFHHIAGKILLASAATGDASCWLTSDLQRTDLHYQLGK